MPLLGQYGASMILFTEEHYHLERNDVDINLFHYAGASPRIPGRHDCDSWFCPEA